MDEHEHHEELIKGISKQYAEILDHSEQAVYIYLDDNHKVCNAKFAEMLGFSTPGEWASTTEAFLDAVVAENSQETLVSAYQDVMEKNIGSVNDISWKQKNGETVSTQVMMVPIAFEGHLFALHFVSKK